jgi:hypothetical protein
MAQGNQVRIALKQLERTYVRKLMLALSHIPMFDRKHHSSVPACCPWRKAAGGGQGGRLAIAKRRETSLRATRRLATLDEGGRSVVLPLPTIPADPTPNPSTIGVMINPGMDRTPAAYSSTEPSPFNRA